MMSTVTIRSRLPSSQSTECSPFMSPSGLLSPSFSEDTLWMPSGDSTPNRFHSSFQGYLDTPEKYSSDENRDSLLSSKDPLSKGLGIVQSPKQGPLLCHIPEPLDFGAWDPSSSTPPPSSSSSSSSASPTPATRCNGQGLAESVQAARGRSLRSSRHETQPCTSTQSQMVTEDEDNSRRHSLLLALLQAKTSSLPSSSSDSLRSLSQERQTVPSRILTPSERSRPTSPSRRQRCSSHQGHSWLQWSHKAEVAMPLLSKRARRHSCDGRVESRPFLSRTKSVAPLERPTSSRSGMTRHTKRSPLTISTDVARRGSLRDTSMSSISVGSIDRRQSISSTMSDVSDSSHYLYRTSSVGLSNTAHASDASNKVVPRKGGPPVHVSVQDKKKEAMMAPRIKR